MPRNNLFGYVFALASLVGCKNTSPEVVWVDSREPTKVSATQSSRVEAITVGSTRFNVPALPERTITLGDSSARLRRVQDLVDRNRQLALSQIEAKLLDAYLRDIDTLAREKRRTLEADERDGLGAAYEKFITLFEAYASRRGPPLAELSMLADFPDSDPRSLRTAPETARIEQRRLDRAKTLRADIAALDEGYRSETSAIILSAEREHAAALREFRESIELMRLEADERATSEAKRQVQGRYVLKSVLETAKDVTMPPQAGRTAQLDGDSTSPLTVATPSELQVHNRAHDVAVFVRMKGYQLVERSQGRDATKEFEAWMAQRNPGPSAR